ncbi:hypothetical protein [Agarilytica rhodophyticola]|uniref:hypothetical protein n=1 Tax=Agarilytica rhodophyticola TaxID=1737490 RepID=UPI0013150C73|nr:hypothetical protein [Agarilytica rhodophyticola]
MSRDKVFIATTSVQDFKLSNVGKAPEGYPLYRVEDRYSKSVFAKPYEQRKACFISHVLKNPGADSIKCFFYELIRLQQYHQPIHERLLFSTLDYIDQRRDCADFLLTGVIRLYYQFFDNGLLSDEFREKSKQTILNFKYWPDEPGIDSMCYWTENHHIIFSVNEFLAGQLFPDSIFKNSNKLGKDKKQEAKKRIEKWLEMRFFTGFSEWLSNVYYDEDFAPLLNLVDFSDDYEVSRRAQIIIDLMLYDMAINSYYGMFSCTHGRTYTKEKINPYVESTSDTAKLLFGMGCFANKDNMSAVMFTLSTGYRVPKVIIDIAHDNQKKEWINKQRVSINFKDAAKWGYGNKDLDSAMGLLLFGGYCHPRTFSHMVLLLDKFNWWKNKFFLEFVPFKKAIKFGDKIGLTTIIAWLLRKDMSRNVLSENNIYTYRTPDYMLSTSQNYRKGYGGDQQHIWQATLNDQAVCFTTHPGGYGMQAPNAYWHGNGFMPKAIQHKNVVVVIYNTPCIPTILLQKKIKFTHAFFPSNRFDHVIERNGWIFGKKDEGYIALYSRNPYFWQQEGEYRGAEIISHGYKNIWLVEMGRQQDYGCFNNFVYLIQQATLIFRGLNIHYYSPSIGVIDTGWSRPLKVNRQVISTSNYRRYDNESSVTDFGAKEIYIKHNDEELLLKY